MARLSPRRARTPLAPLLAALLVAAAGASALERGERAPDFAAPALRSEGQVSLAAHRGKVVYVDFWASWCPPCRVAMPALERLRAELPEDSFQVIAVNVDRDPKAAREVLRERPVGYPSASDPEGRLPERFGVRTMPTSYLIDREGVVRYVHEGFREGDEAELRERIRALLAEGR